jgi:hypothetical protein
MAQQQAQDDGYDVVDPENVAAYGQNQDQQAVQNARSPMQMGMAVGNAGFNQAANQLGQATGNPNVGTPQVVQARKISSAMKSILTDVNADLGEDADPLEKNLKIAQEVSKRMAGISPQLALQGLQQTVKLQEAKNQQAFLNSNTAENVQSTAEKARQAQVNKALGTIVFAKQGDPDEHGLPTGLVSMGSLDPSDPDYAAKAMKIVTDAKANGDTVLPMSADKFVNSKDSTAAIRGQYQLAAAQERSKAALEAAQQKLQSGQMTGREYMMTSRIVSAADLGSSALQNIVELPLGSNTGIFGVGATPGHNVLQATTDTLRNKLSSPEVQNYNTMITGLTRNLAMIESSGLMPQGSLTESMSSIIAREGDTESNMLHKLAEARQIIEKGVQSTLNNPRLPPAVADELRGSLANLTNAIPFTQHDVTMMDRAQRGGKKTSINDIIKDRLKTEQSDNKTDTPMGTTYSEQDITADMQAHNISRDQVLAAYKRKGISPAQAAQ